MPNSQIPCTCRNEDTYDDPTCKYHSQKLNIGEVSPASVPLKSETVPTEAAKGRCSMHGPKCLDASCHHFLKYHDPRSDFYLGTECGNCCFSDVERARAIPMNSESETVEERARGIEDQLRAKEWPKSADFIFLLMHYRACPENERQDARDRLVGWLQSKAAALASSLLQEKEQRIKELEKELSK